MKTCRFDMLKYVSLDNHFNWVAGEDLDENLPLRHVTPLFGSSNLTFQKSKFKSVLGIAYSGAIQFEDLAPSEQAKTHLYTEDGALAWWTLNLKASYRWKQVMVNAGIQNILDKHYRSYSSGISAAGRNVYASLRVNF